MIEDIFLCCFLKPYKNSFNRQAWIFFILSETFELKENIIIRREDGSYKKSHFWEIAICYAETIYSLTHQVQRESCWIVKRSTVTLVKVNFCLSSTHFFPNLPFWYLLNTSLNQKWSKNQGVSTENIKKKWSFEYIEYNTRFFYCKF